MLKNNRKNQTSGPGSKANRAARGPASPARCEYHGVLQAFNARDPEMGDTIVPVIISVYSDRLHVHNQNTAAAEL